MITGPVLVVGRGKTGTSVDSYLASINVAHRMVDDTDGPWNEAAVDHVLADVSLVVPSPGVAQHHALLVGARARNIAIRSEIDLAAECSAVPYVGVTGTNGKTTVTTLITEMLVASGVRARAVGNIGDPFLDAVRVVSAGDPVDVHVVECSSFQLRFAPTFHPRVAVWTNVADDHLDWHGSFGAYAEAKACITAGQDGNDVLVTAIDDPVVQYYVGKSAARAVHVADDGRADVWTVRDGQLVDPDGVAIVSVAELDVNAPHEVRNLAMAAAAARAAGASDHGIAAGARATPRLHHRAELVGQAGGVQWIDDSKATNPHATVAAVSGHDSVVLIAGGKNKGLDLGVLAPLAPRLRHVVAIGDAAPEVEAAFTGMVAVTTATSMREAVGAAAAVAEPGDVVLLSPACASFDWYSGYAARGDDFRAEVMARIDEHVIEPS